MKLQSFKLPSFVASTFLVFFTSLIFAHQTLAADFESAPHIMRLLTAFDRATNSIEGLGTQAGLGKMGKGSTNPASPAFNHTNESNLSIIGMNYSGQSGNEINAFAISKQVNLDNGVLSPTYAYTKTANKNNTLGYNSSMESHEFILGYSQQLSDKQAWGIKTRFTPATISHAEPNANYGGAPLDAATESIALDLWLGGIHKIGEKTSIGANVGFGYATSDTVVTNLFTLGPNPPGTTLTEVSDDARMRFTGVGIAHQLNDSIALYSDYRYFDIETNAYEQVGLNKYSFGFNVSNASPLSFGAGLTYDSLDEINTSAFVRYQFDSTNSIGLAYQHNAAPEVESDFGTERLIALSIDLNF